MSISPSSEDRGLQRLRCFKYYIVQKWESRFTLGLENAKITYYIKKCFQYNFPNTLLNFFTIASNFLPFISYYL